MPKRFESPCLGLILASPLHPASASILSIHYESAVISRYLYIYIPWYCILSKWKISKIRSYKYTAFHWATLSLYLYVLYDIYDICGYIWAGLLLPDGSLGSFRRRWTLCRKLRRPMCRCFSTLARTCSAVAAQSIRKIMDGGWIIMIMKYHTHHKYIYIYKWLSHTMTMEKNLSGAGQLKHVETVNTLGDASNMFKYSNSSIHF